MRTNGLSAFVFHELLIPLKIYHVLILIYAALAFEISLDNEEDAEGEGTQGLVKKHPPRPPKRLQRLNTMEASAPTLQELQDKLESAEKRRQTVLKKNYKKNLKQLTTKYPINF